MTAVHTGEHVRAKVHELMPELWDTLAALVRFKSISRQDPTILRSTADEVTKLFRAAGAPSAQVITIKHGEAQSAPIVYADERRSEGPRVLLYAH
ncbi:hypothetical protein [Saccharothrix variisporea]|uniref:hypothetical protein n=1 Tax=Saccharothrix variisporea TaxID=543527 RepID=UPI000EB04AFC|nr:hypothetical protein [Saccharothrix variisporea]